MIALKNGICVLAIILLVMLLMKLSFSELDTSIIYEEGKVAMVEPIAIIGMGCRFPGASDVQEFWQLMCNGVDAITEVPRDRFDVQDFYHPQPATPGKIMSRWGGFLDQIDHFDAAFFGITPREAARMDPQHRLLLEVAWEAMEDAGQIPNKPSNTEAGVFIGIITSD